MSLQIERFKMYKHKKSQDIYIVLGIVLNATNKNEGQSMVLYKKAGLSRHQYVRETSEFVEKFEEYEPAP